MITYVRWYAGDEQELQTCLAVVAVDHLREGYLQAAPGAGYLLWVQVNADLFQADLVQAVTGRQMCL